MLGGASGAADAAGNPLVADYSWSFSTAAAGSSAAISLWDDTYSPSVLEDPDQTARTQGVELGVKFRSATGGYITGLRYYKGPNNAGPHTGSLWTAGGALADGEQGGNGLYRYGSSAVPSQTWNSEHYWVDVVFRESP